MTSGIAMLEFYIKMVGRVVEEEIVIKGHNYCR